MGENHNHGDASHLLREKNLQAEVLAVESDMLKCEMRSALVLNPAGCPACDEMALRDKKFKGLYHGSVLRNGRWKDPMEACYEDHCFPDGGALHPQIIYVAKPFSLRTTPYDNKTLKINEGQEDEYTITYRYAETGRERTVTYSKETKMCSRGAHAEVIWPPYRERVEKDGEVVARGETILFLANSISPDVSVDMNIIPNAIEDLKERYSADEFALLNPENPGSEALFNVDLNLDGRRWADDCGKGGSGGSVWV